MGAGAPYDNVNALKWDNEKATKLFEKALNLSDQKETTGDRKGCYSHDFIGEVARELGQYKEVFTYLKDMHSDLKPLHTQLISNLEANCYYNGKRGFIKEASSIMNLKSNHQWTDRQDFTTKNDKLTLNVTLPNEDIPEDIQNQYEDDE